MCVYIYEFDFVCTLFKITHHKRLKAETETLKKFWNI